MSDLPARLERIEEILSDLDACLLWVERCPLGKVPLTAARLAADHWHHERQPPIERSAVPAAG
jgi:hypothetical protein